MRAWEFVRMSNHINSVQLVTRKGLAGRWQVSVETLKRRERAGVLPFLKLGRGVRYRLSDVERLEADANVRQSDATIGGGHK
jgi:hypothetical protein